MKCIRRLDDGRAMRVPECTAQEFVKSGYWEYMSKSEWKEAGGTRHEITAKDLSRFKLERGW